MISKVYDKIEDGYYVCSSCGKRQKIPLRNIGRQKFVIHNCSILETKRNEVMPKKKCGTILKNMLSKFGIKQEEGCACGHIETEMNDNGPDWCEAKLDYLVGRISKEAAKRKLPVTDWLIKQFVRRAIRKCKAD